MRDFPICRPHPIFSLPSLRFRGSSLARWTSRVDFQGSILSSSHARKEYKSKALRISAGFENEATSRETPSAHRRRIFFKVRRLFDPESCRGHLHSRKPVRTEDKVPWGYFYRFRALFLIDWHFIASIDIITA
jgi:hypothetical protein